MNISLHRFLLRSFRAGLIVGLFWVAWTCEAASSFMDIRIEQVRAHDQPLPIVLEDIATQLRRKGGDEAGFRGFAIAIPDAASKRVTIDLKGVPAGKAFYYIAGLADARAVEFDGFVAILPVDILDGYDTTKVYEMSDPLLAFFGNQKSPSPDVIGTRLRKAGIRLEADTEIKVTSNGHLLIRLPSTEASLLDALVVLVNRGMRIE